MFVWHINKVITSQHLNLGARSSEALDILSTKIQCAVRWNSHIIRCLGFLREYKKYFTPSSYLHQLYPVEYNSHVWAGDSTAILRVLDCVQERVKVLFNYASTSNSIDLFGHRYNVVCASMFYRYCNEFCSTEIKGVLPENRVFLHNNRLSLRALLFMVDWPVDHTLHYRHILFFSWNIRIWNFFSASHNIVS